jgi:D-mannonate dehydratase
VIRQKINLTLNSDTNLHEASILVQNIKDSVEQVVPTREIKSSKNKFKKPSLNQREVESLKNKVNSIYGKHASTIQILKQTNYGRNIYKVGINTYKYQDNTNLNSSGKKLIHAKDTSRKCRESKKI